jgi:type I site-specific restriction-modification system R (restriction) subunit
VVLFVNGLPLVIVELKSAADENATIWSAFHQLQTYKAELPSLFLFQWAAGGIGRGPSPDWDPYRRP